MVVVAHENVIEGTRMPRGLVQGVADEWVTQLLRPADSNVFIASECLQLFR